MTLPEFLNPTPAQVAELRKLFREKLEKDAAKVPVGGFHEHDMRWVFEGDGWLTKFLENNDLSMKESLKQLWETMEWRKASGINEIREDNIRMEYIHDALMYPRGRDLDGKTVFIFKSKMYVRGTRNLDDLKKCFLYWIERIIREANDDLVTIVFDLTDAGLSNVDMDYTKYIINTFKNYYPCSLNYILIYDLPWILNATFQIIKKLLPAKAVDRLRNISNKNIREYIDDDNMPRSWGGKDDYVFEFIPERRRSMELPLMQNGIQNGILSKKVHFANLSPPESPMLEKANSNFPETSEGEMLRITPQHTITFSKNGSEFVGTVKITNVVSEEVSYKVKTTAPEKFRVRPSTGFLPPTASVTINVMLQHGQQIHTINREKFLVMCIALPNENSTNPPDLTELWKNISAKDASVELHRLKCNIDESGLEQMFGNASGNISSGPDQYGVMGESYAGSSMMNMGADKQMNLLQQTISHLNDTTHRLEVQVKRNHRFQWITCVLFVLLAIAIVYILKIEIKSNASEYCSVSERHH
ncbi:motile sperm domain-containing protein 2-like isoform X1 [Anopheles funestus]|uniref:Major sperm protein n=1 Tax=Anopheles funestus TaxID=62324 RepID=A0A182RMG7_ANOFN|nr:motile sperm domain-containing protein 2-like isoform X1 [Anopheles funestus]XP_049293665.1 motile sperm domain-containing protein 2-like isoform X1 [Anopheles funestus]XP_049293666.1 motile sperm domain-containing protein 2-like isoform X1 [Anopheles funestus]XP_049293667.1 motile sperm domain-containing protein 2-like isoform X1 [Anopheles funestus]XP_049293668.1 motile sperm domain-containing protein 2-like isoform X1 [Anopheles funestus]XP_049293669.1 motile sperm domain-containing prot